MGNGGMGWGMGNGEWGMGNGRMGEWGNVRIRELERGGRWEWGNGEILYFFETVIIDFPRILRISCNLD